MNALNRIIAFNFESIFFLTGRFRIRWDLEYQSRGACLSFSLKDGVNKIKFHFENKKRKIEHLDDRISSHKRRKFTIFFFLLVSFTARDWSFMVHAMRFIVCICSWMENYYCHFICIDKHLLLVACPICGTIMNVRQHWNKVNIQHATTSIRCMEYTEKCVWLCVWVWVISCVISENWWI